MINISYVFSSTSHIIEIKTHVSRVDNNGNLIQSISEKTTIGDACFKKERKLDICYWGVTGNEIIRNYIWVWNICFIIGLGAPTVPEKLM